MTIDNNRALSMAQVCASIRERLDQSKFEIIDLQPQSIKHRCCSIEQHFAYNNHPRSSLSNCTKFYHSIMLSTLNGIFLQQQKKLFENIFFFVGEKYFNLKKKLIQSICSTNCCCKCIKNNQKTQSFLLANTIWTEKIATKHRKLNISFAIVKRLDILQSKECLIVQ